MYRVLHFIEPEYSAYWRTIWNWGANKNKRRTYQSK